MSLKKQKNPSAALQPLNQNNTVHTVLDSSLILTVACYYFPTFSFFPCYSEQLLQYQCTTFFVSVV